MKAILYEDLIRRAYHCGRTNEHGADADIYRKMENYRLVKDGEPSYEYKSAVAAVRMHVRRAIEDAAKKVYIEGDREKLTALAKRLSITEFNKEVIDDIIDQANEIFRKNNLQVR